MNKIIYKFCQVHLPIEIHKNSYAAFRKMNLNMQQSVEFLSKLQQSNHPQKAKALVNMLTYIRKVHSRQYLKSRENVIQQIIDSVKDQDQNVLPALFANLTYTYQPELYLTQACTLFDRFAPQMDLKSFANCLYSLSKIARKSVQNERSTDKLIQYNAVQLTMQRWSTLAKLKLFDCQDAGTLMELLIAYQKMELEDLHQEILEQLSQMNFTQFSRIESQLTHTLCRSPLKHPVLQRKLYDCLEEAVHKKQITVQSMVLSLNAQFDLATKDLVMECQDLYVEKGNEGNIQDLAQMTNVLMRKGIMNKEYSKLLTLSYETLRQNVDINILNQLIPNMGTMINLRLLEKKFINMFLITVKILIDKEKINKQFYLQFNKECKIIENEEIRDKFEQIRFKLNQL